MTAAARPVELRWITTERLAGEQPGPQHRDLFVALWSDPRVAAWLGGEEDEPALVLRFERALAHWEEHGYGVWALRERGTGAFVGYAGLHVTEVPGQRTVEVLYALLPAYQGRGLATEISATLVEVAFERLELPEVVGYTMTTNEASRKVLERAGLAYERELDHAGLPHVLYLRRRPT